MRVLGLVFFIVGLFIMLLVNILVGLLSMILGALLLIFAKTGPAAESPAATVDEQRVRDVRTALATGRTRGEVEAERLATTRQPCPHCAESVLPAAKLCPHCKSPLETDWAAPKPPAREPLPEHMRAYYESGDKPAAR